MIVRPAMPQDAVAVSALLAQLDYPMAVEAVADKIRRLSAHPDALVLVAEDAGRVVGVIALHFIPQLALAGDFCRIAYLCIDETARGAGVGRRLEEEAVREAAARRCDRIEVHSHTRRHRAHDFHARQNFVESPKYLIKPLTPPQA